MLLKHFQLFMWFTFVIHVFLCTVLKEETTYQKHVYDFV